MRTVHRPTFESILYPLVGEPLPQQGDTALHDLALDQVFTRLRADAPRAAAAFLSPLASTAAVEYRQEVFRGLERPGLLGLVEAFLEAMAEGARRDEAAAHAHYRYEAELWHLRAVVTYVDAVEALHSGLDHALNAPATRAEGWTLLAQYLDDYHGSAEFESLRTEARALQQSFAALRYNALIRGAKVTIAQTDGEADLAAIVADVFDRLRQGETADHRTAFRETGLDHVQAWMLERAAAVHPDAFGRLLRFAQDTRAYRDEILERFADEVRFYLAYLDHVAPMRRAGLPLCYPAVSEQDKTLAVTAGWDLALASRLVREERAVVTNDMSLIGPERILVISGPNQGGKTTTARMFGQMHHLAAIGCPIPGTDAHVFLCDRVLTVFEREEQLDTLEGRLGAEVQRLHEVFAQATSRSVIVINEAFASTALHDARILTRDVLERISGLDALAACVTFIDELSRLNEKTVSMVSAVDPADPSVRTFRVERRTADGRAYARALAARHELTSELIRARLAGRALEGPGAREVALA